VVDDYLSERDQWEALKGFIKENGIAIVVGIAIGVGGLYGWNWWHGHEDVAGMEASIRYQDLLAALDRNDRKRALEIAEELHKDYSRTPYGDQAELALARVNVEAAELDDAVKRLRRVMEDSKDDELRQIARVRLARVQLAQQKPDDALATLNAGKAGAFEPKYAEVRGDILLAKGDRTGALAEYRKALDATEPGVVDRGLLQLKINDLTTTATQAQTPTDNKPADGKPADDKAAANSRPQDPTP
jgi:predicted negative regulator of RcsB-dependent stress response